MDLADACVVRMTVHHERCKVWTVDRADFTTYRRHGRQAVSCEFPPAVWANLISDGLLFPERTLAVGCLRNRMTLTMPTEGTSLRTRPSLVSGLKAGDEDRWHEFFRLYGPAIRGFALKAGLTETEADEVVQETCIGVARNVAEYRYEPERCRFKTWLLNLASWRVKNQFSKRKRWNAGQPLIPGGPDLTRDGPPESVMPAHPGSDDFAVLWDAEWRAQLLRAALEKVQSTFSATQFQIFDLNVLKEWPARDVAKALGVSLASVYLAKHRVSSALKKEVARLERRLEAQVHQRV